METELKFQLPPARAAALQRALATASARTTRLQAVYADTADHRLAADLLARLADRFQTVVCARLSYGALDNAVAEIGRLAGPLDHAD